MDHYIYIDKALYEKEIGQYESNTIFVKSIQTDKELNDYIASSHASAIITSTYDAKKQIEDVISSLNSVVFILIISSSILAFAVLYNLATININERKREIATLKVLGFYHKEVDNYINKETSILTLMGIAFGLIFGYYLCHYILITCEIESLMFVRHIKSISYLYTVIIVILFTCIVNLFTHINLKRIDMLESLKTVE